MHISQQNLEAVLSLTSQETLKKLVHQCRRIAQENNLIIGDAPINVLPIPLILEKAPLATALSRLEIFMDGLIAMEEHMLEHTDCPVYHRLMDSLTPGGRHLVQQCTYEHPESLRRRLRRVDGYLSLSDGGYQIVEVNQAAPLALHFYDTSQKIAAHFLNELGFTYKPALIAPRILDWFLGEFSRRNNGHLPHTIALVIEHGYPPKFTDLPGMSRSVEKLAKELYNHDLEIIQCFPYDIRLEGSTIKLGDRKIDMIWRNSVYMTSYREQGLPIEDYETILSNPDRHVIFNATRSWLTRTKETFAVFWDDDACREMGFDPERTARIREVIPYSLNLSVHPEKIDMVVKDKDSWILKPTDAGFGKGVEFGSAHSPAAWEKLVLEKAVPGFVFQRRVPYPTREMYNIDDEGSLLHGVVEHDVCPHHVNGEFTGTALVRANPVEDLTSSRAVKMNLCAGGSLVPLVVV